MTEQEKINVNIDNRLTSLETKFEMFMQEIRDFKTEMRQQNEMRANEIRDLQKKHDVAQAKHDADMKEMNQRFYAKFDAMNKKIDDKFDKFSSQLQMMSVTTILGVGAIVWAIVSALK